MDKAIRELVDQCKEDCRAHRDGNKETIMRLLALDPLSEEAMYARAAANELTREAMHNVGSVSFVIGIDYMPCAASCRFCSFGAKWGVIGEDEQRVLTHDEIVQIARDHIAQGSYACVLRTTEYYPHDDLVEIVRRLRRDVPGRYNISINTGEMNVREATEFFEAGAQSACHMLRLREGIDTPFDPEVRLATMRAIDESPLIFTTGIDPVGPEHTDEEIADLAVLLHQFKTVSSGIQPRINVKGTPFGDTPELGVDRALQIAAALRITSGTAISSGCHPYDVEALTSGGANCHIEVGAVPRTHDFAEGEWRDFGIPEALQAIRDAGLYPISEQMMEMMAAGFMGGRKGEAAEGSSEAMPFKTGCC